MTLPRYRNSNASENLPEESANEEMTERVLEMAVHQEHPGQICRCNAISTLLLTGADRFWATIDRRQLHRAPGVILDEPVIRIENQ